MKMCYLLWKLVCMDCFYSKCIHVITFWRGKHTRCSLQPAINDDQSTDSWLVGAADQNTMGEPVHSRLQCAVSTSFHHVLENSSFKRIP